MSILKIETPDTPPTVTYEKESPRVSQMTLTTLSDETPFISDICCNLALTPCARKTEVGVCLDATIKAERFEIHMIIDQLIIVRNAVIEDNHQISDNLRADLVHDVTDVLKRMVYDVTEIAFNKKGYALNVQINN